MIVGRKCQETYLPMMNFSIHAELLGQGHTEYGYNKRMG